MIAVLLLYLLGVPLLFDQLTRQIPGLSGLPPVLLCYGAGILVASFGLLPFPAAWLHQAAEASLVLALPLLLFGTDVPKFLRSAPQLVLSFFLCVLSVFVITLLVYFWQGDRVVDGAVVSGMLVGLYTGGTPDMVAVGMAGGMKTSVIIYLTIADIICGGLYFLLLVSFIPTLFGMVLPAYVPWGGEAEEARGTAVVSPRELCYGLLLAALIAGASVGGTYLLTGGLQSAGLIILLLTTLSVLASLQPRVRHWRGTFEAGDYLLLVFSLAIGSLADFQDLHAEAIEATKYMAWVLGGTVLLHLLLARLFNLDRDTVMLTSVAALYGPAFIGQVARVLGNRELVFGAIAASLVGYALGNYLGLLMIELLGP